MVLRGRALNGVRRDRGLMRSGEADVQVEVPEPEIECAAAGPVHDGRQQDDGQNDNDHPEEEHNDSGNRVPGYGSACHGRQLPGGGPLIPTIHRAALSGSRQQVSQVNFRALACW